jgi:type IV pilus assembly protein PilA
MAIRIRGQSGFTLIELMMVIMIIAIVAAMAIPGIQNARMASNEASAIATVRTVSTVTVQYRVRFGAFPASINDLFTAGYIDSAVANPFKAGYTFTYVSAPNAFTFRGNPTNPGGSGTRYFFVDNGGVIRVSHAGPSGPGDLALDS